MNLSFSSKSLIGGLLAGVLYSLVALGFVLIFKASGVFNFAQGAMVLFAALALRRPDRAGRADRGSRVLADRRDHGRGRLAVERLVLRQLVNQERSSCSWPRSASPSSSRLRPDPVRQRHLHARHRHAEGSDLRSAIAAASTCKFDLIAA